MDIESEVGNWNIRVFSYSNGYISFQNNTRETEVRVPVNVLKAALFCMLFPELPPSEASYISIERKTFLIYKVACFVSNNLHKNKKRNTNIQIGATYLYFYDDDADVVNYGLYFGKGDCQLLLEYLQEKEKQINLQS